MPVQKQKTSAKQKKATTSKAAPKSKTSKKKTQKETPGKSKVHEEPTSKKQEYDEDLGDKLGAMAEKVFESMKIGVQKLSDFASDSSQVAKIKFEILNLNSDVGQKLWKLHKEKSLENIEEKFKNEFNKIAEMERKIAQKQKQVETVSAKVKK